MTTDINATLWEIVRAVADSDCTYYDDLGTYCIFQCGGHDDLDGPFHHVETCPAVKAQTLVKEQA